MDENFNTQFWISEAKSLDTNMVSNLERNNQAILTWLANLPYIGTKSIAKNPRNEVLSNSDSGGWAVYPIASCWHCFVVGLIARNYGQLTIWRSSAHETDEEEGRLSRVRGKGGLWYGMVWHGRGVWYGGFASKISIGRVRGRGRAR